MSREGKSRIPMSLGWSLVRLAASCAAVLSACNGESNAPEIKVQAQLAGRSLQVRTAEYDLYAKDPSNARELAQWLDAQIAEFRVKYGVPDTEKGIIFANEEAGEPYAPAERWRTENVSRVRTVFLTDRRDRWRYEGGRPYCISRGGTYFRESFMIPVDEGKRLGLVPDGDRRSWICFLTTDQHLVSSFAARREETRKTAPPGPVGSWVVRLMLRKVYADYRELDLQMMQLQRREVLWKALIESSPDLREEAAKLKASLIKETDREHGKIFLSMRVL